MTPRRIAGLATLDSDLRDPERGVNALTSLMSPFMGKRSQAGFLEALRRKLMQYRQQGLEPEQTPFEYLARSLGYQ